MDNVKREKKGPNLDAEEPRVTRDKSGASPEGVSNWSDSSITQNEAGTSANDGSGSTGIEFTSAGSDVDSEVSGSTEGVDSAKVKGWENHHSNISGAKCNSDKESSGVRRSLAANQVPTLLPWTVEGVSVLTDLRRL